MKKIMLFFLLAGGTVFAQVKDTRKVADFSNVKVSQGIEVNFTYGEAKSIVVEVEKSENMKAVKTEVTTTGFLKIYVDQNADKKWKNGINLKEFGKVTVTISNPSLNEVAVSSSAKFNLLNTVKAKTFKVSTTSSGKYTGALVQADNLVLESSSSSKLVGSFDITNSSSLATSSSSQMNVSLKTNKASLESSSSSDLKVIGSANSVGAAASSSASISGKDFKVKVLDAKASSSGLVEMSASEEISGKASSSGKIVYTGSAKLTSKNVSSSGQIRKGE